MVSSLPDNVIARTIAKSYPICGRCKKRMQNRVARGKLIKAFLFWLPLKRYKCSTCNNKRYVLSAKG